MAGKKHRGKDPVPGPRRVRPDHGILRPPPPALPLGHVHASPDLSSSGNPQTAAGAPCSCHRAREFRGHCRNVITALCCCTCSLVRFVMEMRWIRRGSRCCKILYTCALIQPLQPAYIHSIAPPANSFQQQLVSRLQGTFEWFC